MSLWVLGTGTDVGKTVVCAMLCALTKAAYWKPVATGGVGGGDPEVVSALCGGQVHIVPSAYSFALPAAPHVAARGTGTAVVQAVLDKARKKCPRPTVIEGIGGALVPLNDGGLLFADWAAGHDMPCLVVASTALGTMNHTLLTLEAMRARRLTVRGVVLNGPEPADPRDAIERFGRAEVLGCVPPIESLDATNLVAVAQGCLAVAAQRCIP